MKPWGSLDYGLPTSLVRSWNNGEDTSYLILDNLLAGHRYFTGYARFPRRLNVDVNEIEVHGGVTFEELLDSGHWIIGFDLNHGYDRFTASVPRSQKLRWVMHETEKMAESAWSLERKAHDRSE